MMPTSTFISEFHREIKVLKSLIGKQIVSIYSDIDIRAQDKPSVVLDEIVLITSDKKLFNLQMDSAAHRYGNANVEIVEWSHNKFAALSGIEVQEGKIDEIELTFWVEKSWCGDIYHLVQVELSNNNHENILSAGMFYHDKTTQQTEAVILGEIMLNMEQRIDFRRFGERVVMMLVSEVEWDN